MFGKVVCDVPIKTRNPILKVPDVADSTDVIRAVTFPAVFGEGMLQFISCLTLSFFIIHFTDVAVVRSTGPFLSSSVAEIVSESPCPMM